MIEPNRLDYAGPARTLRLSSKLADANLAGHSHPSPEEHGPNVSLSALLTRMIQTGTLTVTDAAGGLHTFGGKIPGPAVTMKLSDPGLYRSLVFKSELAAGEAYMDGTLTFPGSSLRAFLDLMSINRNDRPPTPIQRAVGTAAKTLKRFQQSNPIGQRAAEHRPPLRHRQRALPAVPRRGALLFLRLLSRMTMTPSRRLKERSAG